MAADRRKGDELLEPPAPTKENARFVGWYVGKTPLSFGEVAAVSGTEVTVTAKFEEYSYVYFMNEDGTKVVYYTAAGVAGENVAEADLNAATAKVELTMGKEKGVVGWSTTQDSNTPDASITFVAGDTYVYPVVKTGFWVTFNTDGGDYVAPQFRMEPLDLSTVTPTAAVHVRRLVYRRSESNVCFRRSNCYRALESQFQNGIHRYPLAGKCR